MNNSKIAILYKDVKELIPYANNPRNNANAVDKVAASIAEFGFKVPIVIDKDNVIVAGHTRLLAAQKLGIEKVPVIIADDLNEAQIKAFRIADNKVAEFSGFDKDLYKIELEGLAELNFDMSAFGISLEDIEKDDESEYTQKTEAVQYEPTGDEPGINELYDDDKCKRLLEDIEQAEIDDSVKAFLRLGAMRHIVFDYRNIAEYYAHATPEIQKLMEESALVIIDYDDAIKNGYVKLSNAIDEMREADERGNINA